MQIFLHSYFCVRIKQTWNYLRQQPVNLMYNSLRWQDAEIVWIRISQGTFVSGEALCDLYTWPLRQSSDHQSRHRRNCRYQWQCTTHPGYTTFAIHEQAYGPYTAPFLNASHGLKTETNIADVLSSSAISASWAPSLSEHLLMVEVLCASFLAQDTSQ